METQNILGMKTEAACNGLRLMNPGTMALMVYSDKTIKVLEAHVRVWRDPSWLTEISFVIDSHETNKTLLERSFGKGPFSGWQSIKIKNAPIMPPGFYFLGVKQKEDELDGFISVTEDVSEDNTWFKTGEDEAYFLEPLNKPSAFIIYVTYEEAEEIKDSPPAIKTRRFDTGVYVVQKDKEVSKCGES